MRKSLSRVLFAAIMLLGSGVLAVPASAEERPVMRIAASGEPGTLDPQREVSNVGNPIITNVFDTLIKIDQRNNYALLPGLAAAWKRVDDRTLLLTLRQGVLFQDGSRFTADDVLFTFNPDRILSKSWPGAMDVYWKGISFTKVDDFTVKVTNVVPDPVLEYRLGHTTASIVSKSAFEKAASLDAWARSPVGTGPYRVSAFRSGDAIVLTAFDDYWGGKPTASAIEWRAVPEPGARIAGLASGDYDIITNVPADQIGQVTSHSDLEVVGGPINNILLYVFDTQNPVFADKRIRQAINLCFDRQQIVKTLWGGRTEVPNGPQFTAFRDLYIADEPLPKYDIKRAIQLLKDAGYRGEPLPLRIQNNYYPNEVATAEVVAAMCKEAGLNIKIEIKENSQEQWGALRGYSNTMHYPDPIGAILRNWGKDSAEAKRGILKNVDTGPFFNAEDVLRTSADKQQRRAAMLDVLKWWDDQAPGVLLNLNASFYGKRKDIHWNASPSLEMDFRASNLSF